MSPEDEAAAALGRFIVLGGYAPTPNEQDAYMIGYTDALRKRNG